MVPHSPVQPTNNSDTSSSCTASPLAQQPLYLTVFLPFEKSVSTIVRSYLSNSNTSLNNYDDETYTGLEDALNTFLAGCGYGTEIAFAVSCFDNNLFSFLMASLMTDRKWEDQVSIVLPFLGSYARCLMAYERYDESISIITEIRSRLLRIDGLDNVHRSRLIFPTDLLRARIYLTQGKFDELERLTNSSCAELEALRQFQFLKQQLVVWKKMLLISRLSVLTLGNINTGNRFLGENDVQLLIELLDKFSKDPDEREFSLGLRGRKSASGDQKTPPR